MAGTPTGPKGPPWIPKSTDLQQAKATLEQLDAFVQANPKYQMPHPDGGWQHLQAVAHYLEWASHHQHIAREV